MMGTDVSAIEKPDAKLHVTLLHHGMLIVGLPYTLPELTSTQAGGSPYGAGHVGGDRAGAIEPVERKLAVALGRRLAEVAVRLHGAPRPVA